MLTTNTARPNTIRRIAITPDGSPLEIRSSTPREPQQDGAANAGRPKKVKEAVRTMKWKIMEWLQPQAMIAMT
jgi:hypothetical protein